MSEEANEPPTEEPVKGEEAAAAPAAVSQVERELEDIMENEAYDSDAAAPSRSTGRPPSSTGSVSSSGSGSRGKRRSWKKPKDKPKRPLSAYNIFFKHERQRIVEGRPEECTPEETIRAIESIVCMSRETRRHRKTHGRISFGDLARKIAEKWKNIAPKQKAVFEHYAELDMRRYRKDVKLWKDRKESEAYAKQSGMDGSANASFSSIDTEEQFGFDNMGAGGGYSDDAWAPRRSIYDSMNSSFSSAASDSEFSLEPIPIGSMLRNARPNMHSSMPNLNTNNMGAPGFIGGQGDMMNSMNFVGGMNGIMDMGGGFDMEDRGPPLVISSVNPNASQLDQLRQQNELQQQQLQRQQEILLRQQTLLQRQLMQTNNMMNMNNGMNNDNGMSMPLHIGSNDFSQMQHNQMQNQGDGRAELENYLSNLDLSNV